ncbi:GNAT family N-acetyltransferase [Paenibacillus sp. YN15]|uniref:GNAT family N-acetyltransferase n=1 Tax=Paenibacillus sp. YN15 TaxID=1742774 RepID=UPI0015ECCC8E|nr:GNAT family N-acetyltransferase [Paenibacillus sp. YN15]
MAESEWTIARADPEDAEDILRFLNRVGGESDNLLFGADEMRLTVEQEREWIRSQGSLPHSVTLTAKRNGEIVAIGSLAGSNRERIAHRAEISLVVSRDCWGQGIGRSMMEALIRFGRENAIEAIDLKVRSDNRRAIRLYESLGFKACGTYERFFKIAGGYYDALLMNLSL